MKRITLVIIVLSEFFHIKRFDFLIVDPDSIIVSYCNPSDICVDHIQNTVSQFFFITAAIIIIKKNCIKENKNDIRIKFPEQFSLRK